ncbi:dicarboxylate/amino acid:cation symporter [bacterium]|nr:dicarboxylate/amino acid:cation symporter [bacterium]MDB4532889.1 dicarboxylate/amino acid:cation symporter [bacterium]MDB4770601.1 dicarboxylate/amino acid:cation symporter [bacterium]
MSSEKHSGRQTLYICAAIVIAIGLAITAPTISMKFHLGGEVFLNLLKMMVVPLVMSSVMCGILGMGDVRKLGKPGLYTILYYLCTTILAVFVGLVVVNVIRPGVGTVSEETLAEMKGDEAATGEVIYEYLATQVDVSKEKVAEFFGAAEQAEPSIGMIVENLVTSLFTDNLFTAASETNLLPLIVFSIIFAGMLTTLGENVDTLKTGIEQINHALMAFVMLLMKVAPLGIFCLVTARFGQAQAEGKLGDVIQQTGWYMMTVLSGLGIHALVTLPVIFWFFTRKNPYQFLWQMSRAVLTAFSTASSSATLPVTMECAEKEAGVSERSANFVLPLGATINMDGTALYEAAAAIFIAQVVGMDLSLMQQLTIALTATLAAVGAAGIPEAGLVTMLIVLNAVGLPVEYVALILSVDWLLDRFRTAVNTFGDACGAAIIDTNFVSDRGVESSGDSVAESADLSVPQN